MKERVGLTRVFGLQGRESIFKLFDSLAQLGNSAMKVFSGSQDKTAKRSSSGPELLVKDSTEFPGLLINFLEIIDSLSIFVTNKDS